MKEFTFSLAALLFFITCPAQNSSKYSLAINQVEPVIHNKKANEKASPGNFTNTVNSKATERITARFASERKDEKANGLAKASRTHKCKCAGCLLSTDTRFAIPSVQNTTNKHMDIKAGETPVRYPNGSAYGQLLKELTMKWM
jgi:hypothetical protein